MSATGYEYRTARGCPSLAAVPRRGAVEVPDDAAFAFRADETAEKEEAASYRELDRQGIDHLRSMD